MDARLALPPNPANMSTGYLMRGARSAPANGFTLIEILLVLVILSLVTGIAVFYVGGGNLERELESEAKRLHGLIRMAAEESILNNQEIGFYYDDKGYQFLGYDEKEAQWLPLMSDLLRPRSFPSWLSPEFQGEAKTVRQLAVTERDESPIPVFVMLSSGETTPFKLLLSLASDPQNGYQIYSDGLEPISLSRMGAESE